jgi:hypothetical protein
MKRPFIKIKSKYEILICVLLFLLGAKLLDPDDELLSIGKRISYGEILFCIYMFIMVLKALHRNSISWLFLSGTQKIFIYVLMCFTVWTALSWCINTVLHDGEIMDFFGIPVRVLFYCAMSVFVARWVYRYGPATIVLSYCSGIFAMFCYNFISLFIKTGSVPAGITNNTFSAVLLPSSAVYLALAGMISPGILSLLLMCAVFASTLLVYSLSGLLYLFLGLPAILISIHDFFIRKEVGKSKRIIAVLILSLAVLTVVSRFGFAFEGLIQNIHNKINNIPFSETAKYDVQSGDERWGLALSAFMISLKNPFFGVGEYNFRAENYKNKDWIGEKFLDHKNPHNALAQIPSMFGIPAFLLFMASFYIAFKQLYYLRILKGSRWGIFVLSSLFVFFATANVMDAIFTTTYFYFYAAVIFGIHAILRETRVVQ